MKTRHILFLALVAVSIASCVQPKPEHQILFVQHKGMNLYDQALYLKQTV